MALDWDTRKADANFKKHGVHFSETEPIFDDDAAIAVADDESDPSEQRIAAIGAGAKGRVLVVVYCYRGENIRVISARLAEPHEREQYEEKR
ncbi:MAG: BrnT family toxin [Terracidiphilus sp.]